MHYTVPVTTGDMLKGRSRMLMSTSLPGNSFLAMFNAATTPNSVLTGTATAASMSVILSCIQKGRVGHYAEW